MSKPPKDDDELAKAQSRFQEDGSNSKMIWTTTVKRRARGDKFAMTDLLFQVKFSAVENHDAQLISVLHLVNDVIFKLVQKLKAFYSTSEKRVIFCSIHSPKFISDIYLGK